MKYKVSKLCYILGLLWLYRPEILLYYSSYTAWLFYLVAGFQIICSVWHARKNHYMVDDVEKWIILFYLLILLLNIINKTSIVHGVKEIIGIAVLLYSLKLGVHAKDANFFSCAFRISVFFTTINTISAILFPQSLATDYMGAASVFVLGGDNSSIRLYLYAVLFEVLKQYKDKKISFPLYTVINLWMFSIMRDIATGVVMAAAITGLLIIILFFRFIKFLTPYFAIIVSLAFTGLFVIVQTTFDSFSTILGLLGRNATLTYRTTLWSITLDWIKERPILGYGYLDDDAFNFLVRTRTTTGLFNTGNPHNTYLTLLLSGGIILFCIFVIILFRIVRNCNGMNRFYYNLFGGFLLAFMFHAQVEGRDFCYIIFLCMIFYYYREILTESKFHPKTNREIVSKRHMLYKRI